MGQSYDCHTVIVNVCLVVEFLLDLGVLNLGPKVESVSDGSGSRRVDGEYRT